MSLWSVLSNIIQRWSNVVYSCDIADSVAGVLFESQNRSEAEIAADFKEPQGHRSR
jgi:hypothetical protein